MLDYPHKVHLPLVERTLDRAKKRGSNTVWRKINEGVDAFYIFTVAIDGFYL